MIDLKEIKDRLDQNTAIDADEIRGLCDELERTERALCEIIRYLSGKVGA